MRPLARALVFTAASAAAVTAWAQPGRREATPPGATASAPFNVRGRVGTEVAARLLRSSAPDERIRGIQRAASIGTPEAVALLVQVTESSPAVRSDPRALIELARALARFNDQERARAALLVIVNAGSPGLSGRLPQVGRTAADALSLEEGDPMARVELAREISAMALAGAGAGRSLEQLYGVARGGGSGQAAAMLALELFPPREPDLFGAGGSTMPVSVVRMLGQLGDLRALEVLHAASRTTDVALRSAAIVSLSELGDERAIPLARAAIAEPDTRLRAAAGEAFVLLSAPERYRAVTALLTDEATSAVGVRLAERVYHADLTRLLAARALQHPDREQRAAAIRALGRSPDSGAATALASPSLLSDETLGYPAALALARSPAPNATALLAALASARSTAALGVRGYVVRALVRRERSAVVDEILARLAASKDGRERALGVFGRIALGDAPVHGPLADADARVRRAAAMGSLAHPSRAAAHALLERLAVERDEPTRQVLAAGLLTGDADRALTTGWLLDRVGAGGADAPLAVFALARRADASLERTIGQLLTSRDAVVRLHAARGVGEATLADAAGRLATAYAYETDVRVRRALVAALAARTDDASAPARRSTLETAAQLDPDGTTRQIARGGLGGAAPQLGAPVVTETAWLRIAKDGGGAPGGVYVGALLRADGMAVPMAYDEEGFAIVAGLPPGDAQVLLAPRLPSYEASTP
jgi:hypothetical protein